MCLPFPNLAEQTLAKGEHLGFEWEVVQNGAGYRCGYVRVLPSHPWFERHYDDIAADVHGGLTFSNHGKACPTHGREAEWWVGFDCAHAFDAPDPSLKWSRDGAQGPLRMRDYGGEIRTQEYVEAECRSLCEQASQAQE
jgi:hypothetical protein